MTYFHSRFTQHFLESHLLKPKEHGQKEQGVHNHNLSQGTLPHGRGLYFAGVACQGIGKMKAASSFYANDELPPWSSATSTYNSAHQPSKIPTVSSSPHPDGDDMKKETWEQGVCRHPFFYCTKKNCFPITFYEFEFKSLFPNWFYDLSQFLSLSIIMLLHISLVVRETGRLTKV